MIKREKLIFAILTLLSVPAINNSFVENNSHAQTAFAFRKSLSGLVMACHIFTKCEEMCYHSEKTDDARPEGSCIDIIASTFF
jgi:hypothetical protein